MTMNAYDASAQPSENASRGIGLVLLALAMNFFFLFSALSYWGGLKNQIRQNDALAQQIVQSKQVAANARAVQGMLEGLANDLLALSSSESEAHRLVEKYQIRRMNPPAPPVPPAPVAPPQ